MYQRRKVEKKKKNTKTKYIQKGTKDLISNNKRKEGNLTPVSLSAQASFSFSYDLHKLKLKIT